MSVRSKLKNLFRASWPWLLLVGALSIWVFADPAGTLIPEGRSAPSLSIPWTGEGGQFDLADYEGRVVVLAFWATWCPACRSEGPVLDRVWERIGSQGDHVVGVSVDDAELAAVHRAASRLGMSYPIALASRSDLDRFHVERLPTIYVIDPRGQISESFVGPASEDRILEAVEAARRRSASLTTLTAPPLAPR